MNTSNQSISTNGRPRPVQTKGLEGVVALETQICDIDGQKGELIYAGYDIQDLAANATFEEVAFLLWNGRLPSPDETESLVRQLAAERTLPPMILDILRMMPENANSMAALLTGISVLSLFDGEANDPSPEANYRKAIRLTARIPVLIAAFDRIRKGKEVVQPLRQGREAHNFLYMLSGEEPGEAAERTFDACLVLHAEHGLNASTFTGRVIGATLSDMYSAIAGAVGALKGPLHGGANIRVMEMLNDIDRKGSRPSEYIRSLLEQKARIMGFGHRVYKTLDPRAAILREMLDGLSQERGTRKWYEMSLEIMETMEKEKGLYPNVDFFSASVYATLDIDPDLFTPIFAQSRITGWTAHLLEQWKENRLIRPRAAYTGPRGLSISH
ncbi:MAG: citrate synthase [Bacteroidetes bacterium]|nr:MAG: citrate synthase [Bacteroidota bacterium]